MRKISMKDAPWEEWSSPGGVFHGSGQQLSIALGAKPNAPLHEGGHPFDLERGRLRPGKAGSPLHSHANRWELYVVTTGRGVMRSGGERREVRAGDAILCPPNDAHQLVNTGAVDLDYLLVADNPAVDLWRYPDSGKWGFRPDGWFFRREPVDYWLGEEDAGPLARAFQPPAPPPPPAPLARFVTIADVPENELRSPKGRYRSFTRDLSLALGGIKDVGPWGGGHPFDVQQRRVPPGTAVCPRHAHSIQWELFVVLSGAATVRSDEETFEVAEDDVFLQPPGVAHQILNTGTEDLLFLVVADNTPADIIHYPDSGKWMIKPQRKFFRMTEVDYFDGEE